jgi:hypothetical protein
MKSSKIVVFDLDETLGYFVEFGIFWDAFISYTKEEKKINNIDITISQNEFNSILDLFPEFLRPNILSILNYLKYKKQTEECNAVMIYTNNQGPKEWAEYIKNFFQNKIKFPLFDRIIAAFKINGKKIELCRTTHDKTMKDFIKCTKIPSNTQICFLDDVLYPNMSHDNVYYIKVNPYIYNLPFEEIVNRVNFSEFGKTFIKNNKYFNDYMLTYMKNYNYTFIEKSKDEYEIDKIVTKKTMLHLQTFFNKKWSHDNSKNYEIENSKKTEIKYNKSKRKKYNSNMNKTIKKR